MATTMNISLPEPLKDYVKQRVREGEYSTPSDYARALIRAERHLHQQGQLENLLLEGCNRVCPFRRKIWTGKAWGKKP